MTDPIVVTAHFVPADGHFDAVYEALLPAIAAVHEEPGCILYAIHRTPENTILMIEKWESAELLDTHGAGPAVAGLNASLEGKLARPAEVTRLEPLPAGTEIQGSL
ncbi:antibiotic biosynthesis monooxygenase [Mycetocola manganoxydans]|uniref:Antibiotic biosynthesis monooxygenase n=1 Tax=Mycetocola manganoxydans TaxID=699879 RepID=A0A3L7A086_9MICO|nr:putative quinol monooxygenase [Mycetocola manganoxydans]RLP73537.1 antibiotic biosynthesis monooxygenase [Mycetocola manganoxydans]